MPFLIGTDLPDRPAGGPFSCAACAPANPADPRRTHRHGGPPRQAAGFEALYAGGSAMTGTMGLPDLGIITVEEVCFFVRQVARASGLPVLVDGDTGHGEALNVMHMVRSFEDAGAAAVHIEDQLLPKKCGHLNDKKLADAREAAAKIAAAVKARRHLYIIARTDAADSEGMDGAVARAKLYLDAGADAIFPEALTSAEMFREFAPARRGPAARQYDRVRPHADIHSGRIRSHGLSHGDLACQRDAGRRQGAGGALRPRFGVTAARTKCCRACRPARSSTKRSAIPSMKGWMPPSCKRGTGRRFALNGNRRFGPAVAMAF